MEDLPGSRAWKLDLGDGSVHFSPNGGAEGGMLGVTGAWNAARGDDTGLRRYGYSHPSRLPASWGKRWKGR